MREDGSVANPVAKQSEKTNPLPNRMCTVHEHAPSSHRHDMASLRFGSEYLIPGLQLAIMAAAPAYAFIEVFDLL